MYSFESVARISKVVNIENVVNEIYKTSRKENEVCEIGITLLCI